MTVKMHWRWAFGIAIVQALLAGQAFAQYDDRYDYSRYGYNDVDRSIECKSSGYAPTYCRVDTRYGVTLVRQISDSACIRGRSWDFDNRGIWVSDGCQARFALGAGGPYDRGYRGAARGVARVIRCESRDSRQTYCRVDTRGGVRIARQVSNTDCERGRNWDYDRGGIWVSGGCRADFSVGEYVVDRPGYGMPDYGRIVRCDSNGGRTVRCDADTRGGVRLVRQLSDTRCIEGRNWGYGSDAIWVSGGCRAEFRTGGGRGRYDEDRR
jgi:hypothetical protein